MTKLLTRTIRTTQLDGFISFLLNKKERKPSNCAVQIVPLQNLDSKPWLLLWIIYHSALLFIELNSCQLISKNFYVNCNGRKNCKHLICQAFKRNVNHNLYSLTHAHLGLHVSLWGRSGSFPKETVVSFIVNRQLLLDFHSICTFPLTSTESLEPPVQFPINFFF